MKPAAQPPSTAIALATGQTSAPTHSAEPAWLVTDMRWLPNGPEALS